MTARPQDRLPKKVVDATSAQAANLAQKAIIDNIIVKVTRIQWVIRTVSARTPTRLRGVAADYAEAMAEIERTLKMTRDETAEIRSQAEFSFPDERVQAILTRAVDEITQVILSDEG